MPELRWILIICGALLLLGIYLWGRRSSRQAAAGEDALPRVPPETAQEPHSAFVFRDAPSAELGNMPDDELPPGLVADNEPISAMRDRRRREVPLAADSDQDRFRDAAEPASAGSNKDREGRRTRIEPTLGVDPDMANPSVRQPSPAPQPAMEPVTQPAAPTLSLSSTPPPPRIERRKIIALRIAAGPQRFGGVQLLEAVLAEGLQHGKYDVFHRLDESGASLFSVASMVEPGTFDPARMHEESFPGVTLFTQIPGPYASMLAFNELVRSARHLQETLGGTLQDERGVPLTVHRIERLRQDIREFEQGHQRDGRHRADAASSSTP